MLWILRPIYFLLAWAPKVLLLPKWVCLVAAMPILVWPLFWWFFRFVCCSLERSLLQSEVYLVIVRISSPTPKGPGCFKHHHSWLTQKETVHCRLLLLLDCVGLEKFPHWGDMARFLAKSEASRILDLQLQVFETNHVVERVMIKSQSF